MVFILNSYILSALLYWFKLAHFGGFLSFFAVLYMAQNKEQKEGFFHSLTKFLALPFVLTLSAFLLIISISPLAFGFLITPNLLQSAIFFCSTIASSFAAIWFLRGGVAWVEKLKQRFTLTSSIERNKKTDIRNIDDFLPKVIETYNPYTYFNLDKGVFLGLSETGEPIYWPHSKPLPHVQVAGTTGSGKGVWLGMYIAQNIAMDEAIFVIDPKDDEWLPHVISTAAHKYNRPYHFIDLRPTAPPQLNLFTGATAEQIEEMYLAGFGLSETGKASDFYGIADRQAALTVAKYIAKTPNATPASAYNALKEVIAEAAKFSGYLKEMAEAHCVNAHQGLDLRDIIKNGGAVYVVGSMRNTKVIRLQKMLVVKLIQLAEERDRTSTEAHRKISVVLDEFIYHISKPVLEGLGAARDKGMHVTLAHQSVSDFARAGADLDKEAVKGAVIENCALKLVYRIEDPETAKWFAEKSGRIQVDDEARSVEKNVVLTEKLEDKRMIRQTERPLMDMNMIMSLHPRLGIIFGLGLPQFAFSSPVSAIKSKDNLLPKSAVGENLESAEDALDISIKKPSRFGKSSDDLDNINAGKPSRFSKIAEKPTEQSERPVTDNIAIDPETFDPFGL